MAIALRRSGAGRRQLPAEDTADEVNVIAAATRIVAHGGTWIPSLGLAASLNKAALGPRDQTSARSRSAIPIVRCRSQVSIACQRAHHRSGRRREVWNTRRISTVSPRTR